MCCFRDDRAIKGEVAKETDALSRSVAAHLERLNHGLVTSAESEGVAAVAQAKILAAAQNRQLEAELGLRISALETRVAQCEKAKVLGGCCCISVHDTAVEVLESEVTPLPPVFLDVCTAIAGSHIVGVLTGDA